jgi:DNA mismatch repair protein MutS
MFRSILFEQPQDAAGLDGSNRPDHFADLNLDQVVAAVCAGREEYALERYFWAPLHREPAVAYRHEVVRDLEQPHVRAAVDAFANRMREMRAHMEQVEKLHYPRQQQIWFLDAVALYCDAVTGLAADLAGLDLGSRGLRSLRELLAAQVASPGFAAIERDTRALVADLAAIAYSVQVRGSRVRVMPYAGESDYTAEVHATFAKFERESATEHRMRPAAAVNLDHVEAQVLEGVARHNPEVFARLEGHRVRHGDHVDATVATFDREVQVYLAYLDHIGRLAQAGLGFCLPHVRVGATEVRAVDAFDLALADKLVPHAPVVRNDVELHEPERILVVTGPNQGGKTTYARTFGQLHHLAGLGLPVPAREAHLGLPDRIFTHFERNEDLTTMRGKLEDELVRIHDILELATARSVVIMNESFTSTTLNDALLLGTEVMRRLIERGSLAVCVTFVDELAALGEETVSMVATVVPDDPAVRTFRIVRRSADGLAYAWAIAEKYGLTYERLKARVGA